MSGFGAMTAARLGSTDLFAVAFQVLADLRAEDEADETAEGTDTDGA